MRMAAAAGVSDLSWGQLLTIMLPIIGAAIVGMFVWSVQRIIRRIDSIGAALENLGTRVSVIETKQDLQVETAAKTAKVARKTATKVGVRLPRDLEQTVDPARIPGRRPTHA